jgi:hypothetical protein
LCDPVSTTGVVPAGSITMTLLCTMANALLSFFNSRRKKSVVSSIAADPTRLVVVVAADEELVVPQCSGRDHPPVQVDLAVQGRGRLVVLVLADFLDAAVVSLAFWRLRSVSPSALSPNVPPRFRG